MECVNNCNFLYWEEGEDPACSYYATYLDFSIVNDKAIVTRCELCEIEEVENASDIMRKDLKYIGVD
jgi:hypothetical protein